MAAAAATRLAATGPDPTVNESAASRWHLPLWRDVFVLLAGTRFLSRIVAGGATLAAAGECGKESAKSTVRLAAGFLVARALFNLVAQSVSRAHAGPNTIFDVMANVKSTGKTVAIIGMGISGIQAIKTSLAEGMAPTAFEADADIGGFWRYKPSADQPSIYESTHIDTDRDLAGYADVPWRPQVPLTIKNDALTAYLRENIEVFGLKKYIHFSTKVLSVSPYEKQPSGKFNWKVTFEEKGQPPKTQIFDAVLVASGRHGGGAAIPEFEGMSEYEKPIMHSSMYKDPQTHDIAKNKTVVVVGIGNSGLDIVTEVSPLAKHTYLVSRSGAWITRLPHGDVAFSSEVGLQVVVEMFLSLPFFFSTEILERVGTFNLSNQVRDQAILSKHGLQPKHRMAQQHPLMTGLNGRATLHDELEAGHITVKKGIKRFTKRTVVFTDDSEIEADLVVLATGFKQQASFVDPSVVDMRFNRSGNDTLLYKAIFPCDPQYSSLGFINFQQTITFFASDLQTRAFYQVFFDRLKLPPAEEMVKEVKETRLALCAQYIDRAQLRNQHGATFLYYRDLAEWMGVNPTISRLVAQRPTALWHALFTTWNPLMYRLVGPGRLEIAERWIEERHWTRYYGPYPDGTPRPLWDRTGLWAFATGAQRILVLGILTAVAKLMGFTVGGRIRDHLKQNLEYARKDIDERGIPHSLEWGTEASVDLKRRSVWGKA